MLGRWLAISWLQLKTARSGCSASVEMRSCVQPMCCNCKPAERV